MIVIRNNANESDDPVKIECVYGRTYHVDRDELAGTKTMLQLVDSHGRAVHENWGGRGRHAKMVRSMIHRENIARVVK